MEEMIKDWLYAKTNYAPYDYIINIDKLGTKVSVKWESSWDNSISTTEIDILDLLAWVYSQIPVVTNR